VFRHSANKQNNSWQNNHCKKRNWRNG
jgi:hypothetical protein